jgi:hypothetical protein
MGDLEDLDLDNAQADGFDLLPDGWVEAMMIEGERKQTKAKDGELINGTWMVLDQRWPNRRVWERYNVVNKNPIAQNIGRAQLKKIKNAVGMPNAKSVVELFNLPCLIKLGHEEGQDGIVRNCIKDYKPKGAAVLPPNNVKAASTGEKSGSTPAAAPAQASESAPAPWGATG